MSKNHLAGEKITTSHTTLIPFAKRVVGIVQRISVISKISLGIIYPRLKATNDRRVKIQKEENSGGHCILLKVRDSSSLQEIRVYSCDLQEGMLVVARELRNEGIKIQFV